MAAPNIVAVATILGRTAGAALTTAGIDIVENPAASGKVFKVNTLILANESGAPVDATISFGDASPSATRKIAHQVTVPDKASLLVLDKPVYLEEGDKLTGAAGANDALTAVVSFEEIS